MSKIMVENTDDIIASGQKMFDEAAQQAPHKPLGQKLLDKGYISQDQLDIALKTQRDMKERKLIGTILVELGFITENALGEVLSETSGVKQFDASNTIIDPELIAQVPKHVAIRNRAVPLFIEGNSIFLAMTDVFNVLAIDAIQRYFPKRYKVETVHCAESELLDIIDNYYEYELSIDGILREMEALAKDNERDLIQITQDEESYTNPTVRLVDVLLADAVRRRASDLHFEPEDAFIRLRYRVDGKLRQIRSFHKDYWMAIVVRLKIISGMNIAESRQPQDGRINYNVLGRQVDFRVSTQPTIHGENIVLRVLDKHKSLLTMEELGYSPENIKLFKKALGKPEGVIVITGPTGSGKTTTLYSVLSHINSPDRNIMTLEDPVEYQLHMIRQTNVQDNIHLGFAEGIRSILRQDPDVIFVGEVRDKDTATMAVRAAMTGHQVFTTLHTNDALGAIPRLVDLDIRPSILSGSVVASVAQRLARRLCDHCKVPYTPTEEEAALLDHKDGQEIYTADGCEKCDNTGYFGRVAISEIIVMDEELNEMIAQNATHKQMKEYVLSKGFIPIETDALQKVSAGITDLDEIRSVVGL